MHVCVREGVQADLDHLLSIDEFQLLQVFPEKFWSSPPLQQPQQAHLNTFKVVLVSHKGGETQHTQPFEAVASKVCRNPSIVAYSYTGRVIVVGCCFDLTFVLFYCNKVKRCTDIFALIYSC